MKEAAARSRRAAVLSLAQLLQRAARRAAAWLDRAGTAAAAGHPVRRRRAQGGQESLLVANLALALAAGKDRAGFHHSGCAPCSGLPVRTAHPAVCRASGDDAPTRGRGRRPKPAGGYARHRSSAQRAAGTESLSHAARAAAAEVIVLDPLYSTHDQDENDTRSMAALCQSLLRLRDASERR